MDPFTISAILGIGGALLSSNSAENARKQAEKNAKEDEDKVKRIRENTRFDEEVSSLSVGASRKDTSNNPLASLQIGF